jgi:hypothetical protein
MITTISRFGKRIGGLIHRGHGPLAACNYVAIAAVMAQSSSPWYLAFYEAILYFPLSWGLFLPILCSGMGIAIGERTLKMIIIHLLIHSLLVVSSVATTVWILWIYFTPSL